MGLDMNLYAREKGAKSDEEDNEIGYWRKHANLHGLISEWWYAENPDKGSFNCIEYELSKEQLTEILERSSGKGAPLEEAVGFFWGVSTPEDDEDTVEIITEALKLQAEGNSIIYNSWW